MERIIDALIAKAKILSESDASKVIIFINGLEAGIKIMNEAKINE